jgi:hypothetical protein
VAPSFVVNVDVGKAKRRKLCEQVISAMRLN